MGSMAEEGPDATAAPQVEVADPEQLIEWATEGNNMLNRYKLKEAEELFHKVISHTDVKVKERDKNVITSLIGLSEVYSKRARSMRNNELEWHRMYMHSISSKRKAMEYCENALQLLADSSDSLDVSWFQSEEHKARANLKVLQDCLIRSLQERIVENKSGQTAMEKMMGIKKPRYKADIDEQGNKPKASVNINWLKGFQQHVKEMYTTKIEVEEIEDDLLDEPTIKRSESMESLQDVKPMRKKINFDKVQAAIQDLVKQITTDMRHHQIHKDMTPDEKLTLMSPLADNFDLLGTFKKAIYSDENTPGSISEETVDDIRKEDDASSSSGTVISEDGSGEVRQSPHMLREEAEHGVSEVLQAAANWRHSQDHLNQYKSLSGPSTHWQNRGSSDSRTSASSTSSTTREASSRSRASITSRSSAYRSPTPTRSVVRSQRQPSIEEEDVLRDVGIVRVWRGYNHGNSSDKNLNQQSPYKLESYEESSPLTEVACRAWETKHHQKNRQHQKIDDLSVAPNAAVSETELNRTLAFALTSMADQLKRHKGTKEASELYIYALGIFQKVSLESTQKCADSSLKPHIAHIMQSLGTIKCEQGDFVGGSQLMEESISIYGMVKNKQADFSVATTWFKLGSAFMAEQWKESTLYEYIMKAVKEVMERDVKAEVDQAEPTDADSDDDDEDEGDAYWVSTQEAIGCFNHALEILRRFPVDNKDHHHLYVDVLTKLGDCNIMTGNYDHAIKCYEEALYMFKNIIGSATLPNNAHVLAMLGTTNFLCGNFSKAASMYECAHMLQQHVYGEDDATFEMAFTLSMMGLTFYSMKRFHRSIAWCLKAFELYTLLYKEDLMNVKDLQRWFVTESLYIVGYSYSTLSFHDKALHYLGLSKCMVKNSEDIDVKQCVKILKAMADEYTLLEDNESALTLYNEALEMSQALGNESSAAALQNQLLNRMAGVHVNTKEYSTAALYLQQALDYQKNVENSIKDDLVGILRQLGLTYTLSGDVDRAIECYNDCLDAYQEVPGSKRDEMAQMMGTLGTLYHVKACIQDDNEDMETLLTKAERFYQDAMNIDSTSSVCVQYANYLYQQAQAGDALLAMLPVVHSPSIQQREEQNMTYNGVEHAVLPEHLQQEIDDMDEVTLETRIFSKFLAILCYKQLKLDKDAEDCLVDLFKAVCNSDVALNHSILGYAMLEMSLYPEAAECFANSASLQHDNDLAITNYWLSLCLWSYGTMTSSIRSIFSEALREAEDEWMLENKLREAVRKANQKTQGVRDSGYYDHALESGDDQTDEAWAPVEEITYMTDHMNEGDNWNEGEGGNPQQLLNPLRARQNQEHIEPTHSYRETFMDRGYTSNECLVDREEETDAAERAEKWESIRTVYEKKEDVSPEKIGWESEECETPAVILEMLRQQQELLNREYQVHFDVGIIQEDEEEEHAQTATAETNSTFANMVETPQSILHELERKMVEEQRALERVSRALEIEGTSSVNEERTADLTANDDPPSETYDEWVTTEEVVYHQNPIPTNTGYSQQRKREHSPEPNVYEESWVTEEVVVETPAEILQALHEIPSDVHTSQPIQTSQSSTRQIMPMELSPDVESAPETWTVERTIKPSPGAAIYGMSSADQQHVIDSIHSWDSEGNHVTEETYSDNKTVLGKNNNYETHHQVNGDQSKSQASQIGSWRTEVTNQPSRNDGWRTETTHQLSQNDGWKTETTSQSSRNEGWRTETTTQPSRNDGWRTETTMQPSRNEEWRTETTNRSSRNEGRRTETTNQPSRNEGRQTETTNQPSRNERRWHTETTIQPSHREQWGTENTIQPSRNESWKTETNIHPSHRENWESETTTHPSRNESWRTEITNRPSQNDGWRTETIIQPSTNDRWKTEESYMKPQETTINRHSNEQWTDGRNGNGWQSSKSSLFSAASSKTTSVLHESYTPQQEEEYEEVWESIEETVETPPEILALLRTQQMQ